MVGVVVDYDVVAIPLPIAAIIVIVGRDLKEKPSDVEPIPVAAVQPPDVLRADGARKVSMLPGMIEVIVRIVSSAVVPYPFVILSVHVWSIRMTRLVGEILPRISIHPLLSPAVSA